MKPIGKNIIVKEIVEDDKILDGIFVPTKKQSSTCSGEVFQISTESPNTEIEVGDKILFSTLGVTALTVNEENLIIVPIENVLVIL